MNTPDFAALLVESGRTFLFVLIGAPVAHFLMRRSPAVARVRKLVGRELNRFSDIPETRLDLALVSAAKDVERRCGGMASILGTALWLWAGLFASDVFDACFPSLPAWPSIVVAGAVAAFVSELIKSMERKAVLHRLEHRLAETGSA